MPAVLENRIEEALDFALLNGLLRRAQGGGLIHTPFALTPCPIDPETHRRLENLTPQFNRLAFAVSRRLDFLEDVLGEVVASDPFTRELLNLARAGAANQNLSLQITRSDYFLQAGGAGALPQIRQVELNTIAASFPGAAAMVNRLHRHLLRGTALAAALAPNDPVPPLVEGIREAFHLYGRRDACMIMVVQAGERNIFDQRMLEFALQEKEIPVRRLTLEEISEYGSLREGHLTVHGQIAAITYFRAGYTPDDHRTPQALQARALIENASTISVPDLRTHLAGTKKVQQVLTGKSMLAKFCTDEEAAALQATFAGIFDLEEPIESRRGTRPAWKAAQEEPGRFVLKPQREGGGNNLYDDDLVRRLEHSSLDERKAFILMERIFPIPHPSLLVAEGKMKKGASLSEIGRFGVLLADKEEILINKDAGYLVRTKGHDVREGGVSAGFGHLDSLIAMPPEEAYSQG